MLSVLAMHVQLMEELSFIIVDDHFNCCLPQWYHDNE
jgi:hypothetical protein